ncbi:hypothetical protein L210DRAFT_529836, partial [Boletus edulis BED1]
MVPTWCLRSLIRSICVSIVLRSIGSPDTPVALSGQSTIATRSLAWHVTASQLLSVDTSDTLNRAWNERDETSARQMDGNELIAMRVIHRTVSEWTPFTKQGMAVPARDIPSISHSLFLR